MTVPARSAEHGIEHDEKRKGAKKHQSAFMNVDARMHSLRYEMRAGKRKHQSCGKRRDHV